MPLNRAQQRTLEVGSCVVLSGHGFGFQFGRWPVWNFLAGIAFYVAWVILYAEITDRHPALWNRAGGTAVARGLVESASASTPPPGQGERTG